LIAGILKQDPNGILVLIEGRENSWSRILLKRLSQKLSDDIKKVIVLPRMSAHDFLFLCMLADAILDTPGFSGGKTSLDCFALGLPIVTLASPYVRGRLTIGQYKLMGINDCIAENELNYIELAIKLANNQTWKKEISEKIKRRSHVLFKNLESIKELEQFFIKAYARITDNSD
jgi:predicted O-linked N-acetylglucosamine transferase (SPINDLY family)